MSSIFGGSQNQQQSQSYGQSTSNAASQSYNQAYPSLSSALSGTISNGSGASNQLAGMLGLNGAQGQNQAFQNWQNSTGYQFGLNQGLQSINGNAAASGLLNSGATAKALDTYGQNYANTQYGNYTNQLQGLLNSGNQAAGVVGSTGNVSQSAANSQSTQNSNSSGSGGSNNGGIGGFVGGLLGK
jgi:hypothetical protein